MLLLLSGLKRGVRTPTVLLIVTVLVVMGRWAAGGLFVSQVRLRVAQSTRVQEVFNRPRLLDQILWYACQIRELILQ